MFNSGVCSSVVPGIPDSFVIGMNPSQFASIQEFNITPSEYFSVSNRENLKLILENGPMIHLHKEFAGYGDSPFDIDPVVPAVTLPSVQHFALNCSHVGFCVRYCLLVQLCATLCVTRNKTNMARKSI